MIGNWKIVQVNLGKTKSANAMRGGPESKVKANQSNVNVKKKTGSKWKTVGTVEWSVLAALI